MKGIDSIYLLSEGKKKGESMAVHNAFDIEKICSRIYSECDSLVTWKWDDRFQAVLSEFPADREEEVMSVLEKYQKQLPEYFIVSQVELKPGEFSVKVDKAEGNKCDRCWIYSQELGQNEAHPSVCPKCTEALNE